MKLLVVLGRLGLDGISSVALNYIENIDDLSVDKHVVIAGPYEVALLNRLKKANTTIHILSSRKRDTLYYLKQLYYLCSTEKFDIVHIHGNGASMGLDLLVSKFAKVPVRISHGHSTLCENRIINEIMKPLLYIGANVRFACSEAAGKWLYGNKDFTIINNAINLKSFEYNPIIRDQYRTSLGISNEFVVGHVGYFEQVKNHDFIIDVFNIFNKFLTNSRLILIGDGSLKESIIHKTNEYGLNDCVVFLEATQDVSHYYQAFDVLLFPSICESLGLVTIEAQVSGLPVLASTAIPKEAKCTDRFFFESLEKKPEIWAKDLMEIADKRLKRGSEFCDNSALKKYSIESQTELLMMLYTSSINV